MKNTKIKYFGNKDVFAIRYLPSDEYEKRVSCNLILGGQMIGNEYECYLVLWKIKIENLINTIKFKSNFLYHSEFDNRTIREIFELVLRSNADLKLHEKQNNESEYLPQLEHRVWHYCHLSIDETTSSYSIVVVEDNDKIKFIWEGFFDPCPEEKIGEIFHVSLDKTIVLNVLESFLEEIIKE